MMILGLAGAGLALGGCPSGHVAAGPDPLALQIDDADRSIEGTWVLMQAQANPPLEPVLASLMAAQYGQMRLTFAHGSLAVQGVGIQFTRRYQVTQVDADGRIHVRFGDDTGSTMDADGVVSGDTLTFNGRTPPWVGTGVLQRAR